jgi:hypothetical protein
MPHNPFVKDARLIEPKPGAGAVVLERVEPGVTPEYCTHGKTDCRYCGEWCWLGDKTYEAVSSGAYFGVCLQCAQKYFTPHHLTPHGNIRDHRRADGSH